jgi:hypothetical protein
MTRPAAANPKDQQIAFRLPLELRQALEEAAAAHFWSLGEEIRLRLGLSFKKAVRGDTTSSAHQ